MRIKQFILALCLFFYSGLSINASIIIVTDSHFKLINIPSKARVIILDEGLILHNQISVNLPADPILAKQIAKQRILSIEPRFQNQIQKALQDALDAYQLGITKLPAIVVDQKFVVYGEKDMRKAVVLIEQYRGAK